tara:strand:- start:54 stop:821 length:768 start_codon:yes stop_codon:yes gene_type:complete
MKTNRQKRLYNKEFCEIYGYHAVFAALKNPKRKHKILYLNKNLRNPITSEIRNIVPQINELQKNEMSKMFGNESNHQGIVLKTSKINQPSLEEVILNKKQDESDIIVMLDQVTDPNNIGSIMRSCSLFNCKSIIVSKDNSPDITPAMAKAASGALEIINFIPVVNLSRAIIYLKKNNYWVYGFDSNKKNIEELEFSKKTVIVFGSEGKGLRNLTKKECDKIISIPINKNTKYKIDSLNVSNACSIALFEHFKKNY